MKKNKRSLDRITTGIKNLDDILGGGLPKGSITLLTGIPGAGKTTMAQQICFNNATPEKKALIFQTLSEPAAKTLNYMSQFSFFSKESLNKSVEFVDLGTILRSKGLGNATKMMLDHIKRVKPDMVVIDSFKVFDDLAESKEELRKFTYEAAVQLMAWEITGFLLGEYSSKSVEESPLFSVVDGIIHLSTNDSSVEEQRLLRILKMRGTNHDRRTFSFEIGPNGIEIFKSTYPNKLVKTERVDSRIKGLNDIIGGGLPCPSVTLLGGASGSGKTLFMIESIYRAAKAKQKGIIFSFGQTSDELIQNAEDMGWNLKPLIKSGMLKIVFISQSEISIQKNIQMMEHEINSMGAKCVGIDAVDVFLEKLEKSNAFRLKLMHLCAIIKNAGAMGFFVSDIFSGLTELNRTAALQSVSDNILQFLSLREGSDRKRYIEIMKMRNTSHVKGLTEIEIEHGGIKVLSKKAR